MGDGKRVPCFHCKRVVTARSMEVDRFPVRGRDGGRYVAGNIVPACSMCNAADAGDPDLFKKEKVKLDPRSGFAL